MDHNATQDDVKKKLHGRWGMKRMSTAFPGGAVEEHPGASGQLVYNTNLKTVFAQIARDDDKDPSGKTAFSYFGNVEFSETNDNEVMHCITSASNPKMLGTKMKRTFNLSADGTRLTIIGPSAKYKDATINIEWIKEDSRPTMRDLPTGRRNRGGEEMNIM